ncbi:MAG TPA: hypothetical protein VED66_14605 [Candidatus Sulfotelmatobacter sp.]|nr:hypothetical protein [Candidatus Sulfotelmatobacter sp.]
MLSQLMRVWVVTTLVAFSATAEGREAAGHLQVLVLVLNRAGVEQATILAAERTASRTYQQAAVDIVWMNCLSPAEPKVDQCEQLKDPGLVLKIEHDTQTLSADDYGVAFLGDDGRGTFCDVFYDRILRVYQASRASEATILGIVMAHELGHLLLGLNAHSAAGLMRSQWGYKDFSSEQGATFSRQEAQKICARLKQATLIGRATQ